MDTPDGARRGWKDPFGTSVYGLLLREDFRDKFAVGRGVRALEATLGGVEPPQGLRLRHVGRLALGVDRSRAHLLPGPLPSDQDHVALRRLVDAEGLKLVGPV